MKDSSRDDTEVRCPLGYGLIGADYVSPASQPVSRAGWLALPRLQHLNAPKLINSVIT